MADALGIVWAAKRGPDVSKQLSEQRSVASVSYQLSEQRSVASVSYQLSEQRSVASVSYQWAPGRMDSRDERLS